MRTKKIVIQFVSVILIIIGIVRVFASETTFELLRNKDLWLNDIVLQYIFRASGGFILFHGIMFLGISKEMIRFRSLFGPYAFGLLTSGTAMLIAGYLNYVPVWLYGSDALISYFLAVFCFYARE